MNKFNCSIGNKFKKNGLEVFQWKKAKKSFILNDLALWWKDIDSFFNLRKIILYVIIVASIFGYGWYQGKKGTPVKVDIGYGKEAYIELTKDSQLHITKDGYVYLEDMDDNVLKQISVKDIPGLKRKLAPYGFQFRPVGIIGSGVSDYGSVDFEAGAGVSWFRAWKLQIESFVTNKGIYPLGASYSLEQIGLKNSGIGVGVGKGWAMDNRGIIYFRMNF